MASRIHAYTIGMESQPIQPLGREELAAIIDNLPDLQTLHEVLDNFCFRLHDDKKIPQVSSVFSQIMADNPGLFKNLANSQKAQILFDKYTESTLTDLIQTEAYRAAYHVFQQTLGMDGYFRAVKEIVDSSNKGRVHVLHSDFVAFAIAKSLGVKVSDLRFNP
jgi:hypothetical protein